jgi:thioredoxin-related protein
VKEINIELYDNRQLAKDLNIESVPTLILYKGKNPIWRKSGAITKNEIVDALESSL